MKNVLGNCSQLSVQGVLVNRALSRVVFPTQYYSAHDRSMGASAKDWTVPPSYSCDLIDVLTSGK